MAEVEASQCPAGLEEMVYVGGIEKVALGSGEVTGDFKRQAIVNQAGGIVWACCPVRTIDPGSGRQ